ncbi:MAG: sulfur carrier protein [bacterium]|nr:MAG: sulfur carrier protein [bacterium]KAF0147825.1 MAG: sulfur carrier protein [bacterium]KAF0167427.1 MAG: sulfur carrier protein [bacterium]TXT17134.1 MAG: sulfur carrier protein [bacterium]
MITLRINGQPRQFPAPLSIAELMLALDLAGKRVAVEKNGEIVPRSQHGDARVVDGDQLEIVVAVGGG